MAKMKTRPKLGKPSMDKLKTGFLPITVSGAGANKSGSTAPKSGPKRSKKAMY